ncbi:MAG: F0F1 ATP synthase subunit C [Thermoleophilia bacterium]|nr:F0F1 ATP synthase subunit C [Thermoleophilia bacterium]
MDNIAIIGIVSMVVAGLTMAIGSIAPALAMGRAVSRALRSIAQQPDESDVLTRILFVGMAMIESIAIYCFVISIILIFVNPFWGHFRGG